MVSGHLKQKYKVYVYKYTHAIVLICVPTDVINIYTQKKLRVRNICAYKYKLTS